MDTDQAFMRRALELADMAEAHGEVPVGCVIVRNRQIIGEGWNRPISDCDPTAHAEIIALRTAARHTGNYRLPDCTVYVTIEPCTMCIGAMVHARIQRLVFGATESKAGAVVSNTPLEDAVHFNHHILWEGGILASECSEKMRQFFRKKRNAPVKLNPQH